MALNNFVIDNLMQLLDYVIHFHYHQLLYITLH